MVVIRQPKMVVMLLAIKGARLVKRLMLYFYLIIKRGRPCGVILGMSTPQEGQHHDLFEIQTLFNEICAILKKANINLDGLFLNADPGFDSQAFRDACESENIIPNVKPNPRNSVEKEPKLSPIGTTIFDEELYKDRSVIEHSNAWIDGFKALLVRFEFSVRNWSALHFIAFSVIFLRKINKKIKV